MKWSNDKYKDDEDNYGLALSIGHLTYHSRWVHGYTYVILMLGAVDYETAMAVNYHNSSFAPEDFDPIKAHLKNQ